MGVVALAAAVALVAAACNPGWAWMVAGTGASGNTGDAGPADHATFEQPGSVVAAPDGSYYVVDGAACVIRHISADKQIDRVAGNGTCGDAGDGGPATQAEINPNPGDYGISEGALALGPDGTLYLVDTGNDRIRSIAPDGTISTYSDAGDCAFGMYGGIAVLPTGVFFGCGPDGIFMVSNGHGVSATGTLAACIYGFIPDSLATDTSGNLYVVDDRSQSVVKVGADGRCKTLLASGTSYGVRSVSAAPDGTIYVSEMNGNALDAGGYIVRVDPDGTVTTIAGTGNPDPGTAGQSGHATTLDLSPFAIAVTPHRGLLVTSGHGVYRIDQPATAPGPSSTTTTSTTTTPPPT